MLENIWAWITQYPLLVLPVLLVIGYLLYRATRFVLGRVLYRFAIRSENVYDDLMVDALHPFRFAWLVPLALLYAYGHYALGPDDIVTEITLFLLIIVAADLIVSVLSGLDEIYKHRPDYSGVSVTGYFGLGKVLVAVGAVVLIVWTFSEIPPVVLFSGIGAWLAVLLLIFRDTIISFLASVQISSQELVREGDWIEVPGFSADGTVEDVSLGRVKVRNFDNTTSFIPTYKMVEVPFKNWSGMQEMGARRIKRTITLDIDTIRFCDLALLERLTKYDLIAEYVSERIQEIKAHELESTRPVDFPLDGPGVTNVDVFMAFVRALLLSRDDLHHRRLKSLVRVLEPNANGLPVQVFAFTKSTVWAEFETTQAEIFNYLLAALPHFDLTVCSPGSLAVSMDLTDQGRLLPQKDVDGAAGDDRGLE